MKNKSLKIFAIIFLVLGMIGNLAYRKPLHITAEQTVMRTDSEGYYQYLPHVFIFDWDRMDKMHWAIKYGDENKNLNLYTCGVAVMQMPFFLFAHGLSYFLNQETTGYTDIYFNSIFFASLFYVLLGLILIYKFLRRFIDHRSAMWTIVMLFFGTNLLYYTNMAPGMAHTYSFALMAIFVYFTPKFYEKTNLSNLFMLAWPLGLATLVRPTNILMAIFLFLYGIDSLGSLGERWKFWIKRWYFILVLLVTGFVVFIPQMLYWHHITGKYIFYSYVGGGFSYWKSPQIFTVFLNPRNGWFIYTPIMIFAVATLIYLTYKRKYSAIAISMIMVLIIYINASWWCPTFSAAAGYRALIDFFPFMAIPLAIFMQQVFKQKKWVQTTVISFFLVFIVFNILFAYKYRPWLWWNTDWQWSHLLTLFKF